MNTGGRGVGLRGFGFVFENGGMRNWYVGPDGVQRWADTDQPVDSTKPFAQPIFTPTQEPPTGGRGRG